MENGLLYAMIGSPTWAISAKCATTSSGVGRCEVGGSAITAVAPASAACWAHRHASAADLPETPGTTGTRPIEANTAIWTS